MEIKVNKTDPGQLRPKPMDESSIPFGTIFSDHMFLMDYESEKGWSNARIEPYGAIAIDPAAIAIHYAQEIFEGLKVYKGKKGALFLFRARDNFKRLNRSAKRLCMPELDPEWALKALKDLALLDQDWVPSTPGTSLYVRPTMIATEPHLGVRPSKDYLFYIITGPVGAYYKGGLTPIKIYVEDFYVRAVPGGTGDVKASGNYAASLLAGEEAKKNGFDQVLWLDAIEHLYVEEVGAMNMFFVIGDEVITGSLTGSILPGITRDTVIQLLKEWGISVSERSLSILEIIDASKQGLLTEAFGAGTAAVISPVGQLSYKGEDYVIGDGKKGELALKLYNEIVAIQYGEKPDAHGWVERIS